VPHGYDVLLHLASRLITGMEILSAIAVRIAGKKTNNGLTIKGG
jgi:hypothetical protein